MTLCQTLARIIGFPGCFLTVLFSQVARNIWIAIKFNSWTYSNTTNIFKTFTFYISDMSSINQCFMSALWNFIVGIQSK